MRTNQKPEWKNIEHAPGPTRTMLPDGTYVEEKKGPIPFSFKMVDPAGWVVEVPHATGATIRGFTSENPYGALIREKKKFQGFLLYHTCPYVQGIPIQGGDKPCTDRDRLAGPRALKRKNGEECCEHMTALIKRRQAAQKEKSDEYAASFKTHSEKQTEITLRALQALAEGGHIGGSDGEASTLFRNKKR